jgi:LPS-assembly protein
VSGPGVSLEGRVAPSPGSTARLQVDALWDLDREPDEVNGVPGAHRLRLGVFGDWDRPLGPNGHLHADLDLVGDPLYTRDFTFDLLQRDAPGRRSAIVATHREGPVVVEASAAWLEVIEPDRPRVPLAPAPALADLATLHGGLFGASLPAFHRWPSLEATLVPVGLLGPLTLSGRAGLARFAPPSGVTSDGGADGVGPADRGFPSGVAGLPWQRWQRTPGDPGELDGRWQPGERLAVTRLDARAELAASLALGQALAVRPFVRGAVLGYRFDAVEGQRANAWALTGLELSSALSRRFGELRHVIEPRLEWRLGSAVLGPALPAFGYDAWDRAAAAPPGTDPTFLAPRVAAAAPPGLYHQARLALGTRLERGGVELLRAEVGQEVDLVRRRLAEATLDGTARAGGLTAEAQLRVWPERRWLPAPTPAHASWLDDFSELRLRLTAHDARGDTVTAGLAALGPGGSGRLAAGVDALFDPRPSGLGPQAAGTLGARVRLGHALVGYEVVLPARTSAPLCNLTATRTVGAWQPQQQTASLEWDSPCQCFRAKAKLHVNDCGTIGFDLAFDLGKVGASTGR